MLRVWLTNVTRNSPQWSTWILCWGFTIEEQQVIQELGGAVGGGGSVERDRIRTFTQTGQNVQTAANRSKQVPNKRWFLSTFSMTDNNTVQLLQYYIADLYSGTFGSLNITKLYWDAPIFLGTETGTTLTMWFRGWISLVFLQLRWFAHSLCCLSHDKELATERHLYKRWSYKSSRFTFINCMSCSWLISCCL